ncbi:MAG: fimbrillin family protein [Tannerella sp.]|jgi:hypothetical protein|nr:fimbrillin family protein [Tannerella sp.]
MSVKRVLESWRIVKMRNIFMLAGALTIFLASCETEYIPDIPDVRVTTHGAKEGNFTISVQFAEYGEGDMNPETLSKEIDADSTLTIARHLEPETVLIRLDDDLIIRATLSVDKKDNDHPVRTRAFAPNSKIFIVAYDSSATNVFTKVFEKLYKINALNALVRDDGSTDLINLPAGDYKLIAYSYNDSTTVMPLIMPASITNVDPMYDLVWGSSPTTHVVEGTITPIAITMYHKLSQVTLVAKTRDGTDISDFSNVTMPGYTVDMTTMTGALAKNTATLMTFDFPAAAFPHDSVKSDTRIVYTGTPGDIPTVIHIGSMTVDGKVLPDFSSTFAKSLQSGYSYTMRMLIGDSPDITDDLPPAGFTTYVGAFWKHDQTGERLIRMPRILNDSADGVWTAQVIEGRDWIVLDTLQSGDVDIYSPSAMLGNDGSFEGAHQLPAGASTFVSGYLQNMPDDDEIYFRIGLRGTVLADSVRYGFVLLTYSHNNLRQRIWIRQGEDADYLFSNTDPVSSSGLTDRTVTRRFSPYNLTAATLNAPVTINGGPGTPPAPGIFTQYPSQAGAYFRWADLNNPRYAWDPITNPVPSMATTFPPGFWTDAGGILDIGATHESCPAGYRRPTSGPTYGNIVSPFTVAEMEKSEIHQSLFMQPQDIINFTDRSNSIWGFYADGFFDRLQIVNAPTGSTENAAVSVTTNEIAYRGRLFFNTANNASLFFPAPGRRRLSSNTLDDTGNSGIYFSSTATDASEASSYDPLVLYVTGINASVSVSDRRSAYNIRCVVDPCTPITSVSISPIDPPNMGTGNSATLTATVSPSGAAVDTWKWERSFDNGTTWYTVVGATSNTLAAKAVIVGVTQYRAIASNSCSSATSNVAFINGTGKEPAPPTNITPYVGAFWRNSQRGERLIRLVRPGSGTSIDGDWTATVVEGTSWIRLDTDESLDAELGWKVGNDAGVDDMMADGANVLPNTAGTSVSGTLDAVSGQIYFRIGLTESRANGTVPRYGIVLFTYNNHERSQRIWIRQGEDADFLMRSIDPLTGSSSRPAVRQFTPFNLTADAFKNGSNSGGPNALDHPQLGLNGGVFVDYPTQAGAYFQWSVGIPEIAAYARRAYHPVNPITSLTDWKYNTSPIGSWNDGVYNHGSISETCPPGYHRPNDGATNVEVDIATGSVTNSEMRQSLWLNPQNGAGSNNENLVWGYYADGFFDRRQIVNAPGAHSAPFTGAGSVVSISNHEIAYVGSLFFNIISNASLFFPNAGIRSGTSSLLGALNSAGDLGRYWTSTSSTDGNAAWTMASQYFPLGPVWINANVSPTGNRIDGETIRCVKD